MYWSNKAVGALEVCGWLTRLLPKVALHKLCCVLITILKFIVKLIVVLDKKIWRVWFQLKILSLRIAQIALSAYWGELYMSWWGCRRIQLVGYILKIVEQRWNQILRLRLRRLTLKIHWHNHLFLFLILILHILHLKTGFLLILLRNHRISLDHSRER